MLNVSRQGTGPASTSRSGPRLNTVLGVVAVHVAVLSALVSMFHARQPPSPPADISIPVVFMPPAPAPAAPSPEILASSTLPVPTKQEPAVLAPLPLVTVPPGPTASIHHPLLPNPGRGQSRTASTPALRQPLQPNAPSASAAPAAAPHDVLRTLGEWEARIRQAVQNVAIYPASARLLHREGRAQVRFDYDRGAVENAAIAQTSHFGTLDNAALAAVTRAAIPDPPAELGRQKRTMLVWVQFKLVAEE